MRYYKSLEGSDSFSISELSKTELLRADNKRIFLIIILSTEFYQLQQPELIVSCGAMSKVTVLMLGDFGAPTFTPLLLFETSIMPLRIFS